MRSLIYATKQLHKQFQEIVKDVLPSSTYQISSEPISKVFDPYLSVYVEAQDKYVLFSTLSSCCLCLTLPVLVGLTQSYSRPPSPHPRRQIQNVARDRHLEALDVF